MVDLPGLFLTEEKLHGGESRGLIRIMVKSYMEEQRSVVLAIVSAQEDIGMQHVTTLARRADVEGSQTIGIITKPDTLPKGLKSERNYFKLADNQDMYVLFFTFFLSLGEKF